MTATASQPTWNQSGILIASYRQNGPDFLYPCSKAHNSGLEWNFSKVQKPSLIRLVCTSPRHKIQDNCSPRIQAMVMQRGYPSKDFWSIHVQTLITQAWNWVSWKFKNLKLTVWSALALWTGSRSIPPLWAYLWILDIDIDSYLEYLFWHVANTIGSLNPLNPPLPFPCPRTPPLPSCTFRHQNVKNELMYSILQLHA